MVVAKGERNGGVRRRTGAKLSTPHPRAPPNRALTSLLPQAVPLGHGLEHPLGPELVQVIAINHNLGEVRGFQNLQLEHGFAHLLDVWDSRSAWTCLEMKMSERSNPRRPKGRNTHVKAPGSGLDSLTKHGFQQPRLDLKHLGIFQVFGNFHPWWDIFPFWQRPHLQCLESKITLRLGIGLTQSPAPPRAQKLNTWEGPVHNQAPPRKAPPPTWPPNRALTTRRSPTRLRFRQGGGFDRVTFSGALVGPAVSELTSVSTCIGSFLPHQKNWVLGMRGAKVLVTFLVGMNGWT